MYFQNRNFTGVLVGILLHCVHTFSITGHETDDVVSTLQAAEGRGKISQERDAEQIAKEVCTNTA
jgi:hypothetical protein